MTRKNQKIRIIKDPKVLTLMFDTSPDNFSMETFLEEVKAYKGTPELNFTIAPKNRKGIYKLRKELSTKIGCIVDEPFLYDKKIVLTGRKLTSIDEVEGAIIAIKLFCTTHLCELIGFTLL